MKLSSNFSSNFLFIIIDRCLKKIQHQDSFKILFIPIRSENYYTWSHNMETVLHNKGLKKFIDFSTACIFKEDERIRMSAVNRMIQKLL